MAASPGNAGGRAFGFLRVNQRPAKPRTCGITEIRGPYYTPMGKRYLQDVLETMGQYVDSLKFAGGSFSFGRKNGLAMPSSGPRRIRIQEIADGIHRDRFRRWFHANSSENRRCNYAESQQEER